MGGAGKVFVEQHVLRPGWERARHMWMNPLELGSRVGSQEKRDETRKVGMGCIRRPSAQESGLHPEGSGRALARFNREVIRGDCARQTHWQHRGENAWCPSDSSRLPCPRLDLRSLRLVVWVRLTPPSKL